MTTSITFGPAELAVLAPAIPGLVGDIRSDHAGETGAFIIYRGILAGSRNPAIRNLAASHLTTEKRHLELLEALLPDGQRSILLPIWRVAGWLTGFLPALAGSRAVYATIDAVESLVDHHYDQQIRKLPIEGLGSALHETLVVCQADEVHHRDEARALQVGLRGMY
jgi:ubiquinone biosynthesis monooxygenase Coq7